jgi:hypothetical protein
MYLPAYGRFGSPDAPGNDFDLTDPMSFNRYVYVRNRPTDCLDPNGTDIKYYFYNSTQSHSGSGHVAVAIGSGKSWRFYEASPRTSGNNQPMDPRGIRNEKGGPITGSNPDELAKRSINGSEFGEATAVMTLKTTAEQDAKAVEAAEGFFKDHPNWVLSESNCADLGYAVADAAGTKMDKPKTYSTPPELKESLEKAGAKTPGKVQTDKPGKLNNSTGGVAKKQAAEAAKKTADTVKKLWPF